MGDIERIAKLLAHRDEEVASAAALVLGELGAKSPSVVEGLLCLAESGRPALQLRALGALALIRPRRAEKRLLPILSAGPTEVRRAAGQALMALGPGVVAALRARLDEAGAEERRIISEVLTGVGGEDAFSTLLGSLGHLDGEQGRQTALVARQQLRALPGAERKKHLAQVKQFLKKKTTRGSEAAMLAAIKLTGFLELPDSVPFLLENLGDQALPEAVRREALFGLRFALGAESSEAKRQAVVGPLLDVIENGSETMAQAAQDTLAFVPLPASAVPRLQRLGLHASLQRARFAVSALASLAIDEATVALAQLAGAAGRITAELAAQTLKDRQGAAEGLCKALLGAEDPDRAWALARVLEPRVGELGTRSRGRLVQAALDRLDSQEPTKEALLRVARQAGAQEVAAALRQRVASARRKKDAEGAARLLRILCGSPEATDEDRFSLAALDLRESGLELKRVSRDRDPALVSLTALASRGYDVAAALGRERDLSLEAFYYVGFHLAEEGEPAGEALLEQVVRLGGRKKIAQAARNKLKLVSD